ncbi:MAG: hypothetical protein HY673_19880 [Chloroflexi bacterium]|nr:hypothetical protein [Chloroflexota bacterium]
MDISFETQAIKWWLKRAAQSEPRVDPNGNSVLFHGSPIFVLSFFLIGFGIFVLILGFTVVPIGTPNNEAIYFIPILAVFFLSGIASLLEGIKGRVTITDEGILAQAPWPWYPRTVAWREISRVTYSVGMSSFVSGGSG